jgi:hypothetical protein
VLLPGYIMFHDPSDEQAPDDKRDLFLCVYDEAFFIVCRRLIMKPNVYKHAYHSPCT